MSGKGFMLTPVAMLVVTLICVAALLLGGCSGTSRIASCAHHGGVLAMHFDSWNGYVVIACHDGTVFQHNE